MKARFILECDMTASYEANMEFLNRCIKDIEKKKAQLKKLREDSPSNQVDLEDLIKQEVKRNL